MTDETASSAAEVTAHNDDLIAACDRICGKYAAYHKDRCPLYQANCEAMKAMNDATKYDQPYVRRNGETARASGKCPISTMVDSGEAWLCQREAGHDGPHQATVTW